MVDFDSPEFKKKMENGLKALDILKQFKGAFGNTEKKSETIIVDNSIDQLVAQNAEIINHLTKISVFFDKPNFMDILISKHNAVVSSLNELIKVVKEK